MRQTEHGLQVAFLDHDQGGEALPTEMGLNVAQWLQLADLMAQVEQGDSAPASAGDIARELNRLSEGLSARYPFRLDA